MLAFSTKAQSFIFLKTLYTYTANAGILSASNIPKLSTHSIAECFPVDNSTEFQNQLEDLIDPRASVCNDFERFVKMNNCNFILE